MKRYEIALDSWDKQEIEIINRYRSKEDYGYVTQQTERKINKIIKSNTRYSEIISKIWELVKSSHGLYRCNDLKGCKTIVKRFKEVGTHIPNLEYQYRINSWDVPICNGLMIDTGEAIMCHCCLDIRNIDIPDFNHFIDEVYNLIFK